MTSHFRFGRRDATEPEIVKGLRKCGYKVWLLDDFDALILSPRGKLSMMDFKSPGGKRTKKQQAMLDRGWPLRFATTTEQALAIVGSREVLDSMREAGL